MNDIDKRAVAKFRKTENKKFLNDLSEEEVLEHFGETMAFGGARLSACLEDFRKAIAKTAPTFEILSKLKIKTKG